jgi:hypothetical protein
MYHPTDPRSRLGGGSEAVAVGFAPADYIRFYELPPGEVDPHSRTWWARGQNFFLAYSETDAGAVLDRRDQVDEYVVLVPDPDTVIEVQHDRESVAAPGHSLVIIPGGTSRIVVKRGGRLVRLYSVRNTDLAALPVNRASYDQPHPNVAPFVAWPDPPSGFRVRVYSLDVPRAEGRFGRIWRCTTFMVNYLEPNEGPRDPSRLSPHSHPDFEQCSLVLAGDYVHHLRWPWTPDMRQWRADEHERCGAPSVTIIPPPAIHTSQAVAPGTNQLVDIFCPPRRDFSEQPGWVLNADEYPLP